MQTLLIIFGILAGIFGLLVSTYFTNYKMKPAGALSKLIVFTVTGVTVSVSTFVLAITIIWPPVM